MDGAVRSGHRAADELHAALTAGERAGDDIDFTLTTNAN